MKTNNLFLIVLLLMNAIACNDIVDFQLEDAKRQPWLFKFIEGYAFIEGKHDFTEDIIEITLKIESSKDFYNHTDKVAMLDEWNIGYKSQSSRVYIKNIVNQNGDEGIVIIKMTNSMGSFIEIKVY